eukprot:6640531-Prymnesium_polylepis.3
MHARGEDPHARRGFSCARHVCGLDVAVEDDALHAARRVKIEQCAAGRSKDAQACTPLKRLSTELGRHRVRATTSHDRLLERAA